MVTKKKELKAKVSGVLLTAILILTMMPWHVMADDTSAAESTAAANTVATESEGVSNEASSAPTRDAAQNKPAATPATHAGEKPLATSASSKKMVKASVKVVYKDGTPVEDGTIFTLEDPDNNDQKDYEVKNGKLELQLISDKQYRLGLSWDDEKMDTHK
ncbi:MAG: hypothetical protein HXM72_06415, partial [Mogibacterium diversum]|nr:hypothetical protein [Mogibacterium diversum]